MAGVDHQPLKICVIHQGFQNLFPDPLVTPPTETAVYILPVPICFRQIPPRRSSAQNPEYTVDKLPGISGIASSCPLFANGIWPDFLPRSVAYIVSMLFPRHFSAPLCFEDYYITLLLTTPSRGSKKIFCEKCLKQYQSQTTSPAKSVGDLQTLYQAAYSQNTSKYDAFIILP